MNTRIHEVMRPLGDGSIRAQGWLLLRKNALFGLSATRILIGIAMLGLLLTNFTSRHVLWGQGSFWAEPYREINAFGGFIEVFDVGSPLLFTLIYLTLIAIATAVILGWRTRIMALLLALGMVALVERASPWGPGRQHRSDRAPSDGVHEHCRVLVPGRPSKSPEDSLHTQGRATQRCRAAMVWPTSAPGLVDESRSQLRTDCACLSDIYSLYGFCAV